MKAYEHVLAFALEHPWNLTPTMMAVIAGVLARRIAGEEIPRAEVEAALANRKNLPQPRQGAVAVIPIYGVIAPRMNLFSEMSGGTTFQQLTSQLRAAMNDKTVKTIVLDIDSPGGSVAGNAEFATEVMRARTKKPIIAQAQYTAASAAYGVAAAATEIVAAPSARVGGVGTYSMHTDLSEALKQMGVKRTFISAGEGKVDGNETEPLGDEARGRMQLAVNQAYETFVSTVVRGRGHGMTPEKVRGEWKALVYSAADAKANGMIDRIATLDETLARLLESPDDASDARAATDVTIEIDGRAIERAIAAKLPALDDTPQEASRLSGQDRRAQAKLEAQVLGLLMLD
jgi:signal peptide peptidase SppA